MEQRYLVTGFTGQLGYDVVNMLKEQGNVNVLGVGSEQLDITSRNAVEKLIMEYKPNVIIHCAAYTNVKQAEQDEEKAKEVNVEGTKNLVLAAKKVDAKFMYISTDYVFDGTKKGIYEVIDQTNPINVYGKTKLDGEKIARLYDKTFIVRTSWVFGISGNNFVKTMLNQALEKQEVNVVSDQFGSPTYTVDLAKLLISMSKTEHYGIYHAHNEGFCSWYEFTNTIYKEAELQTKINPVLSTDFPSPVKRPLNSRLSTQSLSKNGFELLPHYEDAVKRYIKELNFKK